ncbi:polysaccharide deacetylase family protein [Bradyrhizobium sp.]|uniref:polysaccharide deacetylase family protein n=1 Tax=Bradyrhizobium sp. TaxID=376 RepID=UPI003C72FC97
MKKAVTQRRLVLDIHGLGPKPKYVEPDEAYYWCEDLHVFDRILDAIPDVSARSGTPIEITFDDGNASDFTCALPALIKRGLVASFFVCAGRIGRTGYLDKKAMKEIVAAGMIIGSHGWSHIDWRNADRQTLTKETEDAKRTIEDTIGMRVDSVAIPFGSYNRRVIDSLNAFSTVYTSDGGLAPPLSRFVPRVSYNNDWSETSLSDLASQRGRRLATLKRSLVSTIKRMR